LELYLQKAVEVVVLGTLTLVTGSMAFRAVTMVDTQHRALQHSQHLQVAVRAQAQLVNQQLCTEHLCLLTTQLTSTVQQLLLHSRFGLCADTKVDSQYGTQPQLVQDTLWVALAMAVLVFYSMVLTQAHL
jgi:hypothetical protein